MAVDIARIAEAIDHLVTAPMSNWTILKGIPLGTLYATARRSAGGPLSLAAAGLLANHVRRGDTVLVVSGFIMRDYGLPETDGPIGAAVLARAIALGLGGIPVGISEASVVPCMQACFNAAGLIPAPLDGLGSGRHRCGFAGFPVDAAQAEAAAHRLLDELRPKALIAIERPGAGADGEYHGGGGFEISSFTAKTDVLFAMAQQRRIPTIGIGDLGNELGLGVVADDVSAHVPLGNVIAARLAADVAVIANISNWGAYGVAACLAALLGNEAVFHDGELELRLIDACVRAGAIDPVGGQARHWVDGTDARTNAALVDLLRSVVALSLREGANIADYQRSWRSAGA
ncbi:MAG TPA: glutamate cyclase domain-containing protein [Casimicrobiaceae bacterium]|nr:glutamate cyclase domain-containing protein [Casimicrobiaceae bacterium]